MPSQGTPDCPIADIPTRDSPKRDSPRMRERPAATNHGAAAQALLRQTRAEYLYNAARPETGCPFMARLIFCLLIVAFTIALASAPARRLARTSTSRLSGYPTKATAGRVRRPPQPARPSRSCSPPPATRSADASKPLGQLNTLRDLFAALRQPPPGGGECLSRCRRRASPTPSGKIGARQPPAQRMRLEQRRPQQLGADATARCCVPPSFTRSFAGAVAGGLSSSA